MIEIRNPALEAAIHQRMEARQMDSAEQLLLEVLESQNEHDRWLVENRSWINRKIAVGLDQANRGEVVPEDQLDAYLAARKAQIG